MRTVTIVGLGRAGGALAVALDKAGFSIEHIVSRDRSSSSKKITPLSLASDPTVSAHDDPTPITSEIILIAVPDPFIVPTAELLSERITRASCVLHISGSLPSDILSGIFGESVSAGSLHPLVSLSDPLTGKGSFHGVFFCVEGDVEAVNIGKEIVTALGGRPFTIDAEMKPLYHAAAVMSAGHVVALFDLATEVLSRAGVAEPLPSEILWPLIASTVENLKNNPTASALTGSFARGDVDTIKRHIGALRNEGLHEALEAYCRLGERSVKLARAEGLDDEVCRSMTEVLNLDKEIGE